MLPVIAGQMALQYLQQQNANKEAKRQARANIYQQNANQLGAPSTAGVQAARVNRQARTANSNMLGDMAGRAMVGALSSGGGAPEAKEPGALAQDYLNNPVAPGNAGYAGRKVSGPGAPSGTPAEVQMPALPEVPDYRLQNPWE